MHGHMNVKNSVCVGYLLGHFDEELARRKD
jgi:hypothetical protein